MRKVWGEDIISFPPSNFFHRFWATLKSISKFFGHFFLFSPVFSLILSLFILFFTCTKKWRDFCNDVPPLRGWHWHQNNLPPLGFSETASSGVNRPVERGGDTIDPPPLVSPRIWATSKWFFEKIKNYYTIVFGRSDLWSAQRRSKILFCWTFLWIHYLSYI